MMGRHLLIFTITTIIGIFSFPYVLISQNIYFNTITVEDGLSQNSVVDITQDKIGVMWLATQDGLNRYDGNTFEKFNYFFNDITQTQFSKLGTLYSDKEDNLWVGTIEGYTLIRNGTTGIWDTLYAPLEISSIKQLDDDTFMVGTYDRGLIKVINRDSFSTSIPYLGSSIYSITEYGDNFFISTELGLHFLENEEKSELISSPINGHQFSDVVIARDQIWVSTFGAGLFRYENGQLVRFENIPDKANIQDMHLDRSGNLWVATYGDGLFMINESIHQFKKDSNNRRSLGYDDILCIHESREGILWFGSDGGGVSYIDPQSFKFSSLTMEMIPDTYPVEVVRSVSVGPKGIIWIGTSGLGLTSYNPESGTLNTFRNKAGDEHSLSGDRIVSLYHDKNGKLWIGTQETGLNILHQSGEISRMKHFPESTIWFIQPSATGDTILLGTRNEGLLICDINGDIISQFNQASHPEIPDNNLRAITYNGKNNFYIGTEGRGIFQLDLEDKSLSSMIHSIPALEIKSLLFHEQKLWIGTAKSGLGIWNPDDNSYEVFNDSHGLSNNVVYSLIPGSGNEVWVSTNWGICRITPNTKPDNKNPDFHCFTTDDGLQGMEFNTGASYRHVDGSIFFGGLNGINWFHPDQIKVNDIKGQPLIGSISINNKPFVTDTLTYRLKGIKLSHNQDFINIGFFTPDYSRRKSTQYAYRLTGLNNDWTFTGTQKVAGFTNIPPGDYTFQLGKVWNDTVIAGTIRDLHVTIVPAFWQTWWFKTITILLITGGGFIFYRSRTQYLKDQKDMAEQIKELEMLVLRSQMNPHFIFNSLNSIKSYIIKADRVKASEYISDFAHMVRMILQNSRESEISLQQELESLKLYIELEKMRFKQEVIVHYLIDADINLGNISIPPLLLQPYVENAIWHGLMPKEGKKELTISILKIEDHITCRIEDNGIGRKASTELRSTSHKNYKSLGMGITSERIKLHNKVSSKKISTHIRDKIDNVGNPLGTLVSIDIPLGEAPQ